MDAELCLEDLDILRKIEGLHRKRINYNNGYKENIICIKGKSNQKSNFTQNPVSLLKDECFDNRTKANPGLQIHQICEFPIHYNFESLHPDEGYVECTLPKHRNQLPNHLKDHNCDCMKLLNDSDITKYICTDPLKNKAL